MRIHTLLWLAVLSLYTTEGRTRELLLTQQFEATSVTIGFSSQQNTPRGTVRVKTDALPFNLSLDASVAADTNRTQHSSLSLGWRKDAGPLAVRTSLTRMEQYGDSSSRVQLAPHLDLRWGIEQGDCRAIGWRLVIDMRCDEQWLCNSRTSSLEFLMATKDPRSRLAVAIQEHTSGSTASQTIELTYRLHW